MFQVQQCVLLLTIDGVALHLGLKFLHLMLALAVAAHV